MKVTFDPAASDDLDRAFEWIAKDSPRAAYELIARIEAKVSQLATPELTYMGRPGLIEGTRELLEWPYHCLHGVRSGGNRDRFRRARRTGSRERVARFFRSEK